MSGVTNNLSTFKSLSIQGQGRTVGALAGFLAGAILGAICVIHLNPIHEYALQIGVGIGFAVVILGGLIGHCIANVIESNKEKKI